MPDPLDGFLRYDELNAWLDGVAADHPNLVAIEQYGTSFEGRALRLVAITDGSTGAADTKPAHWVDASIHAIELTGTAAACALIHHLVTGHRDGDPVVTEALRTRAFYVVPRVNPDGAEWALADNPRYRRSSVRPWPWHDAHRWPGLQVEDIDGDGRVLHMRIPDPNGAWMAHPDDARLMIHVPAAGPPAGTQRYRVLLEGAVTDYDGWTIPTPRAPEGLDLNRNFPAGWGTNVSGSGDHPLSEPEIDALVRAIVARPNICGYNAFHTSGGVLLRPSSTQADAKLPPGDVWIWKQLATIGTELTGYPAHSVFEDFTWDPNVTMSGAADDWAYDHLGVFSWTTEFWDVIHAATGTKQSTHFWYLGPTDEQLLAVLRWCDEHHPAGHADWYHFDHPQLGAVELGGWDDVGVWANPPVARLRDEVMPHARFAVHQALCSPRLEIGNLTVQRLGDDTWRVDVGVMNTGWLPTDVSERARSNNLVRAATVELVADQPASIAPAPRVLLGQLEGRAALRFHDGNDGTPDRAAAHWIVTAPAGTSLEVVARHQRAGTVRRVVTLG